MAIWLVADDAINMKLKRDESCILVIQYVHIHDVPRYLEMWSQV